MVIHFEKNGKPLCETKGKKVEMTTKKSEVTCKRCIKRLMPKSEKITKKKKKKFSIEYDYNKRFHHCLIIDHTTILKLGNDLTDKIETMVVYKKGGMMSTSINFIGPVKSMIASKNLKILKSWFQEKKNETNNNITVMDVKEAFETI